MKHTVEQIRAAAHNATYYVTPGGLYLHMLAVMIDSFVTCEHESGNEFVFYFKNMVEAGENPEFYHLVRTKIEGTESTEWFEP